MTKTNKTIWIWGAWMLFLGQQIEARPFTVAQAYLPEASFGYASMEDAAQGEDSYQNGTRALDERQWDRAIAAFNEVIRSKGGRADGALYWRAYAQNKLGQRTQALATLESLRKEYPNSRWLNTAKALDLEVRQASGQPVAPENEGNDDLKLLALNGLQNTDPERAIPLLEKFINSNDTPKLKERALFILAQSGSPQARDIMARIAKGSGNPDLQMKALNYLGLFGGTASKQLLSDIYASSADVKVKRQILNSFMVGGDKDRLLAAAKGEKTPELRRDAIHELGVLGAANELSDLYRAETSTEGKEAILRALMVSGNADKMIELARTEKDPKLRLVAIHSLGVMGSQKSADALVSTYETDKDPSIRKAAVQGLFIQGNTKALVALAKKETDPAMKKDIVSKLSVMGSKEATDYLMEILK